MADSKPPTLERVVELARPLAGERPAGPLLDRRDAGAHKLYAELDRCHSLAADPSWAVVQTQGEALLGARTKDLRLAVALARAWWERHDPSVVHLGLRLVGSLLRELDGALHPVAAEDRADALELLVVWVDERWSEAALPPPLRPALVEALADLIAIVRERLGDGAPDLGPLERLEHELRRGLPEPSPPVAPPEARAAPPSPPADEPPAGAATAPPAAPAVERPAATSPPANPSATQPAAPPPDLPPAPASAADVRPVLKAIRERQLELALLLRRDGPTAPLPYRLLRQAVWLQLDAVEITPQGVVPLPPPGPPIRQAIDRLARHQQWGELLAECEGALPANAVWLDLQHHAHTAMSRLGPAYAAPLRALEHELRGLLERLPRLVDARFRDNAPLAGPDARAWLSSLAAGPEAPAAPARPTDPAGLHALAGRAGSARERFLVRRDLARACLAAGRPDVAAGLLAALCDEARRHGLHAWEPELFGACLSEFVAAARTLGNEARARLGVDNALAELSALHPPLALALGRDPLHPRA